MDHNVLYTTTLLESIASLLKKEGIQMSAATAISIEKVLLHTDLAVYNTFSKLKYRLVPIISRNKEEQEKLYKIFDSWDEKVKEESLVVTPPEVDATTTMELPGPSKEKWYAKPLQQLKAVGYPKAAAYTLATIALLVSGYLLWNYFFTNVPASLTPVNTSTPDIVVHDSVAFYSGLKDSTKKKSYSLDWRFPDTLITNQWKVTRQFSDTGLQSLTVYLKNKNGRVVDSATQPYTVLCEKPPALSIEKITGPPATTARSAAAQYRPLLVNPSKDSALYKYKWSVNDQPVSNDRLLSTRQKFNGKVKLLVYWDTPGLHCSTDSLTALLNDVPALTTLVTGDGALKLNKTINWSNMGLSLLLLLLLPLALAFAVYKLLKQKFRNKPVPQAGTAGMDGPYSIDFKNQDHLINPEVGISRLADILRKRQVSDIYKLNIRKTISNTVRSAGLPQLAFTPLTKPTDYLIFLEKSNPENHQVRLFEYLLNRLQIEQVQFEVYEYIKEPLFLSNEKRNHIRIPIERLASLYPGRTLLIFGEVRPFVFPLKSTIKDWVSTKLAPWQKKIIITPYSRNDWDQKEQLLITAGFTVLPADLEAQHLMDYVLYGQIDKQSQTRFRIPETYPARFLSLQEFDELRDYLSNEHLLNWVCALAVYPSVNWNLTLAIGKAIEKNLQNKGLSMDLVNYPNLLRISRINWLQDGIISDTLKIQMLNHLDNETEALARQALLEQLHNLDEEITGKSLIKHEYDVQEKLNAFLLNTYTHQAHANEDIAFVQDVISKNQLDQAQEIYLQHGSNTLIKNPYQETTSISPESYFKSLERKSRLLSGITASMVGLLLIVGSYVLLNSKTGLLHWNTVQPSTLSFVITHPDLPLQNLEFALMTHNEGKPLHLGTDTLQLKDVMITDTSKWEQMTINTNDGNRVLQDSFKLNSNWYTVLITQPVSVPVTIYYKDNTDSSLAYTIERNLPGQYTTTVQQQAFQDTSIRIHYFTAAQQKDAETISAAINRTINRNVSLVNQTANANNQQSASPVAVYVTNPAGCTPIAITALPPALTEIWHEPVNNRLININLPGRIFYYSTGDRNTYGTYRIDEVCQQPDGVYKITARSNRGYNVYFVRNISAQGFDLSICQNIYTTKEEIRNINESNCSAFVRMSPYYETNPDRIYLPSRQGPLANSELVKLQKIEASLKGYLTTGRNNGIGVSYSQSSYRNNRYISNAPVPDQYLRSLNVYLQRLQDGNKQTIQMNNANPFQRNYFTIALSATTPPDQKAQTKVPPVNQVPSGNTEPQTNPNEAPQKPSEELLGIIQFDNYNTPDGKSLDLIRITARELRSNKNSKIRLEASYSSKSDYDQTATRLQTVKNLFYKDGVSQKDGQVLEKITEATTQRQQQNQVQQQKSVPSNNSQGIRVIGINFKRVSTY